MFVRLSEVIGFVARTRERGVPERVALRRAERRFGMDRKLIKAFVRSESGKTRA